MFGFAIADLCLNLPNHMKRCIFGPAMIQIGTKTKPTSTTNASVIDGAIFYPDSSSHDI